MKPFDSPDRIVEFVNDSDDAGDVCLFQLLLKPTPDQIAIVWMTKAVAPAARTLFTWKETWEFQWRERDRRVRSGAAITASQAWPAALTSANHVTLGYDRRRGAYTFRDLKRAPNSNKLYIAQDASVPLRCAEIGIGMAGRPAHFIDAQPNIAAIFQPDIHYYIAFGSFTEAEPLDVSLLRGRAAALHFQRGVNALAATLDRKHQWSIAAASIDLHLNVTKSCATRVVQ